MKTKIGSSLVGLIVLLSAPLVSSAAINSIIVTNGSYSTGTDSQLDISLVNFQSLNATSVLTITNTNVSDVKSISFLDKSGWVNLTRLQNGSDLIARFSSDAGVDVAGQRVVSIRVNFSTPKTYVVGFSLQTADGQTLSSAAAPVTVTGPQVLGSEIILTPASGVTFTRSLTVGSSGADVTALQNKLTMEGFFTGPVTGYFGRVTQAAVKSYQKSRGINSNGVVGPQTRAALNQ